MLAMATRRRKPGRPKGSGKPPEELRRNRVVVMVRDAELATLHRLADARRLPVGTVAYELLATTVRRVSKTLPT